MKYWRRSADLGTDGKKEKHFRCALRGELLAGLIYREISQLPEFSAIKHYSLAKLNRALVPALTLLQLI
jgi:hypothetical protein